MAIIIVNKRIVPYQQKDGLKAIYGDTLEFEFGITDHQQGDEYTLVADYETVVYPPLRPVCAMATAYAYDDGVLTMALEWRTARMRDWASLIAKPMPMTIQLVRTRDGENTTLLLDYILGLPSVADNEPTVYPGDPLEGLLDEKLDKPADEGTPGQVLGLGADGATVWIDQGGGGSGGVTPEYVQSAISSAITPVSSGLSAHVTDSTIHVTAEDKVTWGGKASTQYVDNAVSNAVTPVSSGLSAHVGDSTIHVTSSEKSSWNGKMDTPASAGSAGQVLGITASSTIDWINQQGGGGQPYTDVTVVPSSTSALTVEPGKVYCCITGPSQYLYLTVAMPSNQWADPPILIFPDFDSSAEIDGNMTIIDSIVAGTTNICQVINYYANGTWVKQLYKIASF